MKLYYSKYKEYQMSLRDWKDFAKRNNIKELKLIEAEIDYKLGYFYCSELDEIGESGEGCGKECKYYNPRNGKNGRCRFHKNTYSETEKIKVLKLNTKL